MIKKEMSFNTKYKLMEELGKGMFGTVQKCHCIETGQNFAAKIVRKTAKSKAEVIREVSNMNQLHHESIVQIHDAFETSRQMIIVMELVNGKELFEKVVQEDNLLTETQAVYYLKQILYGVQYMHKKKIVHLDLKPENILCIDSPQGLDQIKLIDFGLARDLSSNNLLSCICGTPEFVAPEVINFDPISVQSDMWSLGVIAYVLMSGISPFLGDDDGETLQNVTAGEFDFEDEDGAFDKISDEAKEFISELLCLRPTERLTVEECLSHPWLSSKAPEDLIDTTNLKRFIARRRWMRTIHAIKAVGRFTAAASMFGGSGGKNKKSSLASTMLAALKASEKNSEESIANGETAKHSIETNRRVDQSNAAIIEINNKSKKEKEISQSEDTVSRNISQSEQSLVINNAPSNQSIKHNQPSIFEQEDMSDILKKRAERRRQRRYEEEDEGFDIFANIGAPNDENNNVVSIESNKSNGPPLQTKVPSNNDIMIGKKGNKKEPSDESKIDDTQPEDEVDDKNDVSIHTKGIGDDKEIIEQEMSNNNQNTKESDIENLSHESDITVSRFMETSEIFQEHKISKPAEEMNKNRPRTSPQQMREELPHKLKGVSLMEPRLVSEKPEKIIIEGKQNLFKKAPSTSTKFSQEAPKLNPKLSKELSQPETKTSKEASLTSPKLCTKYLKEELPINRKHSKEAFLISPKPSKEANTSSKSTKDALLTNQKPQIKEAPSTNPKPRKETPSTSPKPVKETPFTSPKPVKETPSTSPKHVKETPSTNPKPLKETPSTNSKLVKETPSTNSKLVKETPSTSPKPVKETPSTNSKLVKETPSTNSKPVKETPSTNSKPVKETPSTSPKPVKETPLTSPKRRKETLPVKTLGSFEKPSDNTKQSKEPLKLFPSKTISKSPGLFRKGDQKSKTETKFPSGKTRIHSTGSVNNKINSLGGNSSSSNRKKETITLSQSQEEDKKVFSNLTVANGRKEPENKISPTMFSKPIRRGSSSNETSSTYMREGLTSNGSTTCKTAGDSLSSPKMKSAMVTNVAGKNGNVIKDKNALCADVILKHTSKLTSANDLHRGTENSDKLNGNDYENINANDEIMDCNNDEITEKNEDFKNGKYFTIDHGNVRKTNMAPTSHTDKKGIFQKWEDCVSSPKLSRPTKNGLSDRFRSSQNQNLVLTRRASFSREADQEKSTESDTSNPDLKPPVMSNAHTSLKENSLRTTRKQFVNRPGIASLKDGNVKNRMAIFAQFQKE